MITICAIMFEIWSANYVNITNKWITYQKMQHVI